MRIDRRVAAVSAVVLSLLALPSSAFGLVDTPAYLLTKTLKGHEGGHWQIRCGGWRKEAENAYHGRCWRIHGRSAPYTTNGTGYVFLRREYSNWYWSFEVKLAVAERPCRIDGEERGEYEEEKTEREETLRRREESLKGAEEERSRSKSEGAEEAWEHLEEEDRKAIETLRQEEPRPPSCPQVTHENKESGWSLINLR